MKIVRVPLGARRRLGNEHSAMKVSLAAFTALTTAISAPLLSSRTMSPSCGRRTLSCTVWRNYGRNHRYTFIDLASLLSGLYTSIASTLAYSCCYVSQLSLAQIDHPLGLDDVQRRRDQRQLYDACFYQSVCQLRIGGFSMVDGLFGV